MVTVQAKTTKTATFQGAAVDISTYKQFVFKLRIQSITDGKSVQFALGSVAAADFSTGELIRWTKSFKGALPPEGYVFELHSRELTRLPLNTANGKMRLHVYDIDGGGGTSVVYDAWIEGEI